MLTNQTLWRPDPPYWGSTWAPYILNATGEGDCQHTECILRRRYHINARIDPLDNDKDPNTSIIDLRC